jgi:hypothetical protein
MSNSFVPLPNNQQTYEQLRKELQQQQDPARIIKIKQQLFIYDTPDKDTYHSQQAYHTQPLCKKASAKVDEKKGDLKERRQSVASMINKDLLMQEFKFDIDKKKAADIMITERKKGIPVPPPQPRIPELVFEENYRKYNNGSEKIKIKKIQEIQKNNNRYFNLNDPKQLKKYKDYEKEKIEKDNEKLKKINEAVENKHKDYTDTFLKKTKTNEIAIENMSIHINKLSVTNPESINTYLLKEKEEFNNDKNLQIILNAREKIRKQISENEGIDYLVDKEKARIANIKLNRDEVEQNRIFYENITKIHHNHSTLTTKIINDLPNIYKNRLRLPTTTSEWNEYYDAEKKQKEFEEYSKKERKPFRNKNTEGKIEYVRSLKERINELRNV